MTAVSASVVFLTYNQEAFVQEAFQSLLDQDCEDLEIVISDDASTDGTWDILQKMVKTYEGGKRLLLNRNQVNLGVVGNYLKAFEFSSGEVIFTAAGDDVSLRNRCSACMAHWVALEKKPDLIAADGYDMTLEGQILGIKKTDDLQGWSLLHWARARPYIYGASHMMTRRLIGVSPLDPQLAYEDQCFVFRAMLMGGAARLSMPLVKHRRGGISQQRKNYSYEVKRQKLLSSAVHGMHEIGQMQRDAKLIGCDAEILEVLDLQVKLYEFETDMLLSTTLYSQIHLFINAPRLSLAKRLRYLFFVACPSVNSLLMDIKKFFKTK